MPSTHKLTTSQLIPTWRSSIAKFLLSFCGIASFGVFAMFVLTAASSNPASATGSSNQINAQIYDTIALRLLNSSVTSEVSELVFNFSPVFLTPKVQ